MRRIGDSGTDWPRAIGMAEMVSSLKKAGWTGEDLKSFIDKSKRDGFSSLDDFAGGELSKLAKLSLYPVLLEATALRYAMHTTNAGGTLKAIPSECPHGFRMVACNRCLKGAA